MNKPIDISNVVLRTERLILRPWTLDDVDDMYEYAKVEGVGIWAGWLPHKDKEESRRIVENFIKHKKKMERNRIFIFWGKKLLYKNLRGKLLPFIIGMMIMKQNG